MLMASQQNCQTEFPDICVDLIETPGVLTRESMKNRDSLEAHNQFNSVWVRSLLISKNWIKVHDTENLSHAISETL